MSLTAGSRLGPYEVAHPIGRGGMGEVWRARDTRLDREVAIKVLPEELAGDDERLARFDREAKVLASLNHPNIAGLYGIEELDGAKALVLELVEGPTLAERIGRGAIPVDEALEIARQIAEALAVGHNAGIVHRDLKPANVKVKEDGTVKVLDYGLAKALEAEEATASNAELSQSPTLTRHGTQLGVILGTAPYMSPEQAKGKRIDERTDIFAFGAVLYEMLTGSRAFLGEDASDVLASVLRSEPDWRRLPPDTPTSIRRLLRRCLEKDERRRLPDIAVTRLEIDDAFAAPPLELEATEPHASRGRRWQRLAPWALAALLALIAGAAVWTGRDQPIPPSTTRVTVSLPPDQELLLGEEGAVNPLALSPDGRLLVYTASRPADGRAQLFLRRMDRLEATPMKGTEGALAPFFSPNGRWVGFFTDGALQKVAVSGGLPVKICDTSVLFPSASWGHEDTIVFSHLTFGLYRVSANGGVPEPLTAPDATRGEYRHFAPQILPGGRNVLFSIASSEGFRTAISSLTSNEWRTVLEDAESARHVASGHLLFARSGTLLAVPFDLGQGETKGDSIPLLDRVSHLAGLGAAHFAVSETGTLVYPPADAGAKSRLVWVDRKGRATPIDDDFGSYGWPSISPDGRRIAVTKTPDIWVYDVGRGTARRLTTAGYNLPSVWTPDGDRLTISSARADPAAFFDLHSLPVDRLTGPEPLLARDGRVFPLSWTRDGRVLAFMETTPTSSDIGVLEGGEARAFLATPSNEREAMFSPDGNWLAYVSDETGELEVYVTRYPEATASQPISQDGGRYPVWSRDGRELFYFGGSVPFGGAATPPSGRLMVVPVESFDPVFETGPPQELFEGRFSPLRGYDVSPDGQRFVMLQMTEERSSTVHVVFDWQGDLERVASTDG